MPTRTPDARTDGWWRDELGTARRISALNAAGEVLDGVLREARAHDAAYRLRTAPQLPRSIRPVAVVVDPDAHWQRLCQEALETLGGFRVVSARDADEAWASLTATRADIVVTEFAIPGAHDGELAARIKEDERTRDTPVLLVSASTHVVPRAARLSCDAFLIKPCAPAELCRLAIVMVAARRGAQSAPARAAGPGGAGAGARCGREGVP